MSRKRFTHMNCGVTQALERIGDWWTVLIVRDAMFGATRFQQFEESLGISKNILSDRLAKLVDDGMMERERLNEPGERYAYRLTKMGRDLWVVLTALRLWSDKWIFGEGAEPLTARDRTTGRAMKRLIAVDEDGQPIDLRNLEWTFHLPTSEDAP